MDLYTRIRAKSVQREKAPELGYPTTIIHPAAATRLLCPFLASWFFNHPTLCVRPSERSLAESHALSSSEKNNISLWNISNSMIATFIYTACRAVPRWCGASLLPRASFSIRVSPAHINRYAEKDRRSRDHRSLFITRRATLVAENPLRQR